MRIAQKTPVRCSGCGSRPEDVQWVDFEAAWDGPVLRPGDGLEPIPIDDLVLCEKCVTNAAFLLDSDTQRTIREQAATIEVLQNDIQAKDKIINSYQATTQELVDHPIVKPAGRPAMLGVPEEAAKELNARRSRKPAKKKRAVKV